MIRALLAAPGIAECWEKNKNAYDKDFVDRVEEIRSKSGSFEIDPKDIFARID